MENKKLPLVLFMLLLNVNKRSCNSARRAGPLLLETLMTFRWNPPLPNPICESALRAKISSLRNIPLEGFIPRQNPLRRSFLRPFAWHGEP